MKKFLFSLLLLFPLLCQAQTFKGGLTLGGNLTQIDGDMIAGYTKLGINAGFISEMDLTERWSVGFEILFAQKGSKRSNNRRFNGAVPFTIVWDYAEIPVLIKYHDPKGGMTFGAGLSFGRLVRNKYIENGQDLTETFFYNNYPKKTEITALAEISYQFTDFFGLGVRASYSALSLRKDCTNSSYPNCGQFNNVVTIRSFFVFSAFFDD